MDIEKDDTQKLLSEADHVRSLLDSQGWKSIKNKLDQRVLDLQNINNLDISKPETLTIQLSARKMAVDHIWDWLQKDVYGFVEQQQANTNKKLDKDIENFIGRD